MDKGKGKMVEDKKEKEEVVPMDVDGDESKQGNEETGAQSSNQSALDSMNSLQRSLPTTKGTATSDQANPKKRKPGISNFFKCGEKSTKTSSGEGQRTEIYERTVPPMTDASSPKGNTENTASSATLVQDRAPKPPLGKSRFSNGSSSSSPKPTSCAFFPSHLFADPSRAVGNSRLDNSSTGEHVSGYTVVKTGRFTVTSWLSCFQPSTAGGDNDRNRRPNSSSTNVQSENPAAADASDRNTRINNPSPDLSSAAAGDDTDRDRRLDNSSTGEHVSGYTVVKTGRFTVTSWLSCFQPSTAGGDNDRNRRPNSSSTNVQSENPAAADASDRNTRINNPSPDLSSAAAGDDTDRDRRPDNSSSSSNKEGDGAPKEPQK